MEQSLFLSDLHLEQIKPNDWIAKYDGLCHEFVKSHATQMTAVQACPVCGGHKTESLGDKYGLKVQRCHHCFSLFSHRFSDESTATFFKSSEARIMWDKMFNETLEARKEKVFKPMVEWMQSWADDQNRPLSVCEFLAVHTGHVNTLAELPTSTVAAHDPMWPTRSQLATKVKIHTGADLPKVECALVVEGIGRSSQPSALFKKMHEMLPKGGLGFVINGVSTGLDTWMRGAKSLVPPERTVLPSFEQLQSMATVAGFEVLEASTPGQLDYENLVKDHRSGSLALDGFWRYVIETRTNNEMARDLQMWLQTNKLSSLARLVIKKR